MSEERVPEGMLATDEPDLTSKLRGLLVGLVGALGDDAGVQARCREWFETSSNDPTAVDPELTSAATSVVATTGDEHTYKLLRERFLTGATPQEQLRHLYALAEFDDESLFESEDDSPLLSLFSGLSPESPFVEE